VRIVDPDTHEVLPEGSVGEMWVKGTTVAQGYFHNPEATEATFRARTTDGDGPFLRTGDLAFCVDGEIFLRTHDSLWCIHNPSGEPQ
jgi:acyl-CoA synthetase (AMP-forming)/AMP-acid ligase II